MVLGGLGPKPSLFEGVGWWVLVYTELKWVRIFYVAKGM